MKNTTSKTCPQCKELKDSIYFNKRSGKDREGQLRAWCRQCEAKKCKQWQTDNKDLYLSIKKLHRDNNVDKYRYYSKKRKFLLRSSSGNGMYYLSEWRSLKEKYNYTCPCCHQSEPTIKLTVDHIVPLSKGGSNYITNIQPLCHKCNLIKSNKTIQYA
jgi:hypothetical protein